MPVNVSILFENMWFVNLCENQEQGREAQDYPEEMMHFGRQSKECSVKSALQGF